MSDINIIAAVGKNLVLGNKGQLIWKAPGDLKRFKEITLGHPMIMGQKTFESMGSKPLPGRTNIVLTRDPSFKSEGSDVFLSIDEAVKFAYTKDEQIFIIGGGESYRQTIGLADRLYLTVIDAEAEGDTFFPDYSKFKKIVFSQEMPATENFPHNYKFVILEK